MGSSKSDVDSKSESNGNLAYGIPDASSSSSSSRPLPITKPPGIVVSVLFTIVLLPLILFIAVFSVPVNLTMLTWHILCSPFTRKRLEKLELKHWKNWDTNNKNYHKKNTSSNKIDSSCPILIVGAGIGGLSMAHFLLRCGYTNVKVFEKYGDCGLDRGGGHGLIAGSWCFRSMGMPEVYQETVNPAKEWKFDSGRWWLTWALQFKWMHSNPIFPSLSYTLGNFMRSDFLRYLSETLPEGVLHFDHDLAGIQDIESTNVKLVFANGTEYSGSLVIGCDGSKSKVRNLMLEQSRKKRDETSNMPCNHNETTFSDPFYVDMNVWWCVTKLSDIPILERTKWDTGPSRLYFESGAIIHMIANDNLVLCVDYRAPSLRRFHKNWAANSTGADLLEFMKDWGVPPKYWPAAKHALRVAQFAVPKGLQDTDESLLWHNSKNLVLLGDAIHPTPHFFGQGANAAIQDAYCLVRCLHTMDGTFEALEEYVKIRKPPADDIVSKSYLLGLTETAGGMTRLARDLIFFTVLKTGLFLWAAVDINSVRV